ncbi:MAG: replication factor C small subunit [Thermoproteota archaeon]|nr:replication factor C small subunit [Thermoproteota archaeon]MDQ3808458.1 replication factor C small subunit [Thermoproteota archaeon]MDQ5842255.1 replication factor C small subunit [Thermoproteota archaeon]
MESAKKTDLTNLMWSEKYRPKKLREVVDQKEIIRGISNLIKSPDIPHLLFAGPAGVGKTTTALCIAMELLGEEWRKNTLELNASDERGIKMVRERVKEFAASIKLAGDKEFGKPKIIILDEADEMTSEAQTALRRIIEDSARTTRFIIICNYLSQIIEPIQSRCVVFRFTRLPKEDVIDHLKMICEQQGVKYEEKALVQIYEATGGDLRHSINIMQAAAGMGSVSMANITAAIGLSGRARVGEVLRLAMSGRFNDSRAKLLELTQVYGMSEGDFMKYANEEAYGMKIEKPEEFAAIMAEYDYRLTAGAHPEIQLSALLAQLGKLAKK